MPLNTHPAFSFWARLRRRVITVSVVLVLWTLFTACFPFFAVLLSLFDLLRPTRPWARLRAYLAIWWVLSCEVLGVVAAAFLWLAHLLRRDDEAFRAWNSALQRKWTNALFYGAKRVFAMNLELENIEEAKKGPVLIFTRHVSTVDTVLVAALIANPSRLRLRYVLKKELLGDPCIDIVGGRLPNAFVSRGSSPAKDIERVAALAEDLGEDEGVLVFPEGTRFSEKKLERAVTRFLDNPIARENAEIKKKVARFCNVLPPRLGGAQALLQKGKRADAVFVAHCGLEGATRLSDFWRGELIGATLRVHVHRVPAASIPQEEDQQVLWLLDQWLQVDEWVAGKDSHARRAEG